MGRLMNSFINNLSRWGINGEVVWWISNHDYLMKCNGDFSLTKVIQLRKANHCLTWSPARGRLTSRLARRLRLVSVGCERLPHQSRVAIATGEREPSTYYALRDLARKSAEPLFDPFHKSHVKMNIYAKLKKRNGTNTYWLGIHTLHESYIDLSHICNYNRTRENKGLDVKTEEDLA